MAIRDLTSERLYLSNDLSAGLKVKLAEPQAHYLINVLRMPIASRLLVFNGRDGEWAAELVEARKRGAMLQIVRQTRAQETGPNIDYLFAPLKRARLDYMVQKATEMGVARLQPIITQRTIAERVNTERMIANAVEAAEQCGILWVPEVLTPVALDAILLTLDSRRPFIFCDEAAEQSDPLVALKGLSGSSVSVLIGPEGGFTAQEREKLLRQPGVVPLSLGPRIMRADTAAVAALTLVNAVLGDWRNSR